MSLEEVTKLMESDSQLIYSGESWYVLFIDSLNQTCTLSNHPANYVGTISVKSNVKISDLTR